MGKDPSRSLGALYDDSVQTRHVPVVPNIAGSSIGSAYESWLEADQESQWMHALEERRSRANSDDTQIISVADVQEFAAERERQASWDADADLALNVSSKSRAQAAQTSGVSRETPEDSAAEDSGKSGILRSSAVMAAGTLVSRVLGLARTALTAAAIGVTTGIANTWDVANTLPNIIYLLLAGGVINAVLVPQITRALDHSDGGKAYTDRILTLSLTLLFGVTVAFMAAAPLVYRIFDSHNMTADKSHVAFMFSLICLPQIFFYGVYTVFGQVLNARGHFGAFMWSPALANIVIVAGLIAYIVMFPHGDDFPTYGEMTTPMILTLALPATLGIVAQALVLIPILKRAGYSFTPNFQFRGVGLRSASTMAGWAFVAVIVQQIGLIVTTQLLSSQPEGESNKATQSTAFLLFTLPHSLVTLSLVTALFTRMSVAAGRGETDKVKDDISTGIRLSGLASVMLTFGCFALIYPMVGTIIAPTQENLWAVGSMAVAMMVGLVPYSLCLVFQRVFYAYNDAKTPFWMQIVCTGVAIALTLPWFNWHQVTADIFGTPLTSWTGLQGATILGHPGAHWVGIAVGLAQTISNLVQAIMGYVLLKRKIGPIPMAETVRTYVRLAISSLVATAVTYLLVRFMRDVLTTTRLTSVLELAVAGTIFLAIYIGTAKTLRVPEITSMLAPVTRRLKRG